MYIVQMVTTTHYSLQAASLEQLPLWEWWAEHTFQGWGRGGKEPLISQDQLEGQPSPSSCHILLMNSSNSLWSEGSKLDEAAEVGGARSQKASRQAEEFVFYSKFYGNIFILIIITYYT